MEAQQLTIDFMSELIQALALALFAAAKAQPLWFVGAIIGVSALHRTPRAKPSRTSPDKGRTKKKVKAKSGNKKVKAKKAASQPKPANTSTNDPVAIANYFAGRDRYWGRRTAGNLTGGRVPL